MFFVDFDIMQKISELPVFYKLLLSGRQCKDWEKPYKLYFIFVSGGGIIKKIKIFMECF